jgi:hypothetical protein
MASGEQVDRGSWTQLTNSWPGIARMLGLKRKGAPRTQPCGRHAGAALGRDQTLPTSH